MNNANLDFADEVTERLRRVVAKLRSRRMFGGVGLYSGEQFFGIVAYERLWFKVDDGNRGDYESHGMQPFQPFEDRPTVMSYWEVPPNVFGDLDELQVWAARSIAAAKRKRTPKRRSKC